MKKMFFLLMIFSISVLAQRGAGAIKLGYFNPSATDGGFILGYEHSNFVDQAFRLGWSVDWFHVNYVDKKVIGDYNGFGNGTTGTVNELRAKTNIHEIPIMLTGSFNIPTTPQSFVYIIGAIGAEFMFINYKNYENPSQDDFKTSFSLDWRIGAGFSYLMSRKTDVFGELTYHSSSPSWDYEIKDSQGQRRTYERVIDMSGLMLRAGIRFYF